MTDVSASEVVEGLEDEVVPVAEDGVGDGVVAEQKSLAESTPPATIDAFIEQAKQRLKFEGGILWRRFKKSVPDPLIVAGEEYVERASRIGKAIADGFEGKNSPPPAEDESEPKQ